MKKIFHSIMLAAMVLSTVACSQEELTSSYFSDAKAVKISAQIGTSDVTGSFQTRSTPWGNSDNETSNFNTGDKIAVSSSSQDPAVYQLQANGTWQPVSNQYLVWEKKEKTVFKAYYPAKDGVSAETFQQPTDFSKDSNMSSADYMTFEGEFSTNNNPVSLKMERKMARLQIMFETLDCQIISVQIHSNVSGYENGTVQRKKTVITPFYANDTAVCCALLVPTYKDDNETFLSIEASIPYHPSKTFTVKGIPELKAGYSYTLIITINY